MGTTISLPGAIQQNPFRVLDLHPGASGRQVQQQGNHLLVLSEMGAVPPDNLLPWLPPPDRSPEAIRRAIHELSDDVRRIYFEAMWLPAARDDKVIKAYDALKTGPADGIEPSSLSPQARAILSLARLLTFPQSTEAWAVAAEDCAAWFLSPAWDDLTTRLSTNHDPRLRALDAEHVRNASIAAVAEYWRHAVLDAVNRKQYREAVGVLRNTQSLHYLWPEDTAELRRELIDALSKVLSSLLDPVRSAGEDTKLAPLLEQATSQLKIMKAAIPPILAAFEPTNPDWLALNDTLAETHRELAVNWNNKLGDTDQARAILKEVEAISTSEQVRARLTRDWMSVAEIVSEAEQARTLFAGFSPVDNAPTLYRLNGIGQTMIGEERLGDGRAISTLFFTVLWIPIFALKRYVISREGDSYGFYLKGPLTSRQRWWNGIAIGLLVAIVFFGSLESGPSASVPQVGFQQPIVSPPPSTPPQSLQGANFRDPIVVGHSIGGIQLGWSINDAVTFVGRKYDDSWDTNDGGRGYGWSLDSSQFANPDTNLTSVFVVFVNSSGRIEQIQTTGAWFKTKSGIEVGHPRRVLLDRIKPDSTWDWKSGYHAEARSSSGLGWAYKMLDGVETIVMFTVFAPER